MRRAGRERVLTGGVARDNTLDGGAGGDDVDRQVIARPLSACRTQGRPDIVVHVGEPYSGHPWACGRIEFSLLTSRF